MSCLVRLDAEMAGNCFWLCCVFLSKNRTFFLQEVVFYEDGEPKIDGEPGDLKVRLCFHAEQLTYFVMMYALTVTYIGSFSYFVTVPHPHSSS